MWAVNHLADRVRSERLRLNWSVRDAAVAGGISNTWWAKFEDGVQPLTPGIVAAVVQAFGWEPDWATQPDDDPQERLRSQVGDLDRQLTDLAAVVEGLVVSVRRLEEPPDQSAGGSQ